MLGLRFCARAFSSCGKRGPLFIAMRGPLTIVASLIAEHRLQTRRLSSCGSRVQPLRGMWDPPRPGLEPTSPALAGRLPTTVPPGKPLKPGFGECLYALPHLLLSLSLWYEVWFTYFSASQRLLAISVVSHTLGRKGKKDQIDKKCSLSLKA